MAHPIAHAKSSVRKWGGTVEDYQYIHDWFDQTKSWVGHSIHRMFRHHSEGIFEAEKIIKSIITNEYGSTNIVNLKKGNYKISIIKGELLGEIHINLTD